MKLVHTTLPNKPAYSVLNCTNNGIWTVERADPATGMATERIDFVNQEYWGNDTNGELVPFDYLGPERMQALNALRKELNAGLLVEKTEKQVITASFLQKLNPF